MDINTKYDSKEFPEECFCHIDESISYNPDVFTEFEIKDFQNIKYIREDLIPKWHSCSQELPTKEGYYLIWFKDLIGNIAIGYFNSGGFRPSEFGPIWSNVEAWQEVIPYQND